MSLIFKLLGAIGMLFISYGIIHKNSLTRNYLFIAGGTLLLLYSLYLRDPIFVPLQVIFTAAGIYEVFKIKSRRPSI